MNVQQFLVNYQYAINVMNNNYYFFKVCGNGKRTGVVGDINYEECDDGNYNDNDGCSS